MYFGHPAIFAIVGPAHGKNRVNERTVYSNEISEFCMFLGQDVSGLSLELLEYIG
jgi:hypothetical protein